MALRDIFRTKSKSIESVWNQESAWQTVMKLPSWKSADPLTSLQIGEQTYAANPVVMSCCKVIANSVCEAEYEVGIDTPDGFEPMATHPILDLLNRPNNEYSRNDFLQYNAMRLALSGISYTLKSRGQNNKKIQELWPYPTSSVMPVYGDKTNSLVKEYQVCDQIVASNDMMSARYIDPARMVGSVGGLSPIKRDIQLDSERADYLVEMLVNLKIPGVVVKVQEKLSDRDKKGLKESIDNSVGRGKRGDILVMSGGGEVQVVNPLMDMDWPGMTSLIETHLCMSFGVPPILIGCRAGLDRATYSNYETAKKAFYQTTVQAYWNVLSDAMTRCLLRNEGDQNTKIRFRLDNIREFQEDESIKVQKITSLYQAGVITRAEAREAVGYDPSVPPDADSVQQLIQQELTNQGVQ